MKQKSLNWAGALLLALSGAAFAQHGDQGENESENPSKSVHRLNNPHAAAPTVGSTGVITPAITYHGGPLIPVPVIYYIWYGNWNQSNGSDNPAGQQILRDFAHNIGGSPYFKINTSYSAGGYSITGGAVFGGEATDTGSKGTRLSDSGVLSVVSSAISSGKLPYDPNGVYFVLSSSNVSESSGFCTRYCGWHTSGNTTSGHVRYSFVGNANRCLNACAAQTTGPNGNAGVDGMISVVAHELEETTTDADPASGWVDSQGAENADKCAWTFGQSTLLPSGAYYNVTLGSRHYLIQRNLKHTSTGDFCVLQ